jgi:flavodoxin
MKALVVHDSVFGNTEQVAQAVAESIGNQEDVEILRVADVNPKRLAGVKLLIVGSPTRGFRPTEGITDS